MTTALRNLSKAFFVALCLVACNGILGIGRDYHVVPAADGGPRGCTSKGDCARDELCLFGLCSRTCRSDADCTVGRCLKTDTDGAACVTSAQAACKGDACPGGTICYQSECRTACASVTSCLGDQICAESTVCIGTDRGHDPGIDAGSNGPAGTGGVAGGGGMQTAGAGGRATVADASVDAASDASGTTTSGSGGSGAVASGGASGSSGASTGSGGASGASGAGSGGTNSGGTNSGGTSGAGGSAGTGGVTKDPCVGVPCNTPPVAACPDANTRRSYAAVGSCGGGTCSYVPTDATCAFGCKNGACNPDPCTGATCNAPPVNACADTSHLRAYDSPGSCAAGKCGYTSQLLACNCTGGACTTDPCASVTCKTPPTAVCKDTSTRRTYAAAGTCSAGSCSYAPTDTPCAFGCSGGSCKPDPCAGVACTMPPAASCPTATTRRTYPASGTCSGGTCSYAPTDTTCSGGTPACLKGACVPCSPGAVQCSSTAVQTCDQNGQWGTAVPCTVTNGTPACAAGVCGIAACNNGFGNCDGQVSTGCETNLTLPSSCGSTCANKTTCAWPTPTCSGGACVGPPSCQGLATNCGPSANESCCASPLVTGGTYLRSYDSVSYTNMSNPATVSNFRLERFEVSVGRFRKFLAAYSQNMTAGGAGKNPNNASDQGWDVTWNASLPADAASLQTDVEQCGTTYGTWTETAGAGETKPINCVGWDEAFAFCIWDGGRLPTEAEWDYAAAGGSEQRVYPWSSPATSTTIDCSYSNYKPSDYCVLPGTGSTSVVGSLSPKGDGKYGQADLSGNLWEWNVDWLASYVNPCTNCSNAVMPAMNPFRVIRGGGFDYDVTGQTGSGRGECTFSTRHCWNAGFRCARAP